MADLFKDFLSSVNFFDIFVLVILIYNVFQCFIKGFSLSLISFMKWIFSTIITIILVPKLQPIVSEYVQSEFINNVGLGIAIFVFSLFIMILIGKTLSKTVTWTGVGSIDKIFGFLFGFFKGYIVCVCLFSIFNWFYPYQNWGISAEEAVTFNLINNGSNILKKLPGNSAVGHNRYSTTGETSMRNIQPFFADLHMGGLSIAHNGNLTNALVLRESLVKDGAIFRTTSDTETIVQLIAKSKREKFLDKLIDTLFQIQGGYSLILMTNKKLVGARDPFGIRPLVIGKLNNSFIFTSETCALDIVGAKFIREVENGEIVIVEDNKLNSIKPFPKQKPRPCIFEYIYFARPDSLINNKCAYEYRKSFGFNSKSLCGKNIY